MEKIINKAIEDYAYRLTRKEPDDLQQLVRQTHDAMTLPQMLTGRVEGRLLKLLVQLVQPELILEVGTFTGYSALCMAEGLGEKGRIISCEIDPDARNIALQAFAKSPHGHKITIKMGPALETIKALDNTIDLAFIDGDKENYPLYYQMIVEKVRSGGLIIVDNALWSGAVLEPNDEESKAIARTNQLITTDDSVENVLLTVRDGIHIVRKK